MSSPAVPTKVLIVEDDPNIVDLVRSNLAVRGFDTLLSTDGSKVLTLLDTEQPDMVLLDLPPHPGPERITALLNDGTGKFSAPIDSLAFPGDSYLTPQGMVLGDFRNTGRPDVLVTGISFLYFAPNIGGGQFGPGTLTTPAGIAGPVAAGDFNGDGKLDFVTVTSTVAGNDAQTLNVFLGNGDGTFQAGQSLEFESGNTYADPSLVFSGDFNGDGKLDVIAWDGGVYEFLGNGDGTFQAGRPLFLSNGGNFVMADFNRDGLPDIMAGSDGYGNATYSIRSVFLGQPDGSFQYAESYFPTLYTDYYGPTLANPSVQLNYFPGVVGDFNGDGNLDVAIFPFADPTTSESTNLQILYGNGDGTFAPTYVTYPFGKRYVPQFAADLNGDGRADLVELDNYTASFNVVKSIASGSAFQIEMLTTPITGSTGYGRVILNAPSTTATKVSFTASDSAVAIPSVVVPAGSISQDFQLSIGGGVDRSKVFSIQAQLGSSTATAFDYISTPALPVLEFQPAGLIFDGTVYGGANSTKPVTLKNIGAGPLTISAIETGFPFSETDNCGRSLAPGASCTFQVTYTSPFPGESFGNLAVHDNISGVSGGIVFQGIGISPLQISPCCLGFSAVVGGASPSQTLTLSNVGIVPIQVSSVVPTGAGINQTNNCNTIAIGGNCQVNVSFSPTADGAVIGTLTLNTNVPNTTPFILPVSGNAEDFSLGTAASATVSAGKGATYNLNATSNNGFSGAVALSCSGAPSTITCIVTPASIALSTGGTVSYSVTVTTTARSTAQSPGSERRGMQLATLLSFPFALAILVCSNKRGVTRIASMSGVLCVFILVAACGGGGNGGGGGGGGSGTPPGTYTLTVTGTADSASRTTSITLIVQ